jgi:hypothetical protein
MCNPSISSKIVPWLKSLGPTGKGRERPDGPVRARAESCTGLAGTAKSAGIVMALTVAGLVAGEIGGQRILKEQCPGEKIE